MAVLPAMQISSAKHKYTGPNCLGSFCLEGGSRKKLAEAFGKLPKKETLYCYKSKDSKTFVQYFIEDEYKVNGKIVTTGSIALTDFDNCNRSLTTSDPPETWKTPEGIGLGSTEQEVIRAYGKPVQRETVAPAGNPGITAKQTADIMLAGGPIEQRKTPANIGDTILTYDGQPEDLSFTWVLIRKGKVSGIRTGDSE